MKQNNTSNVIDAMHKTLGKLAEQMESSNTAMTPVNLTGVTLHVINVKELGFKVSGQARVVTRFYAETSI